MSLVTLLSGEVVPCEQSSDCLNSPEHRGEKGLSSCRNCKLALQHGGSGVHWRPWDGRIRHKVLDQLKRQETMAKRQAAAAKKATRNRGKMKLLKKAVKAEQQTEKAIIKATRNSGRSRQDGDHVAFGKVTLDTKLQTGRVNPEVKLEELAKVERDAGRAGTILGALVLRNKYGAGVVVMSEEGFARLMQGLDNALTIAAGKIIENRNEMEIRAENMVHAPVEEQE